MIRCSDLHHTLIDSWPGPGGSIKIPNNTYKAVRLLGDGYNIYYSVWCNNEHELYDLTVGCAFPEASKQC